MKRVMIASVLLSCFTVTAWVSAEPTEVVVRVIGKDSKFIGTSMGGARVLVRDVDSGTLLAEGVTAGSTGDTKRIMGQARERGKAIATSDAGKFVATIELTEPRLIEVTAIGPLAQRQSANRVSATQWVVPGKHINGGDGWVLEMPGFVVDVSGPPAHQKLKGVPQTISLTANVTMMCGCLVKPDFIWDAKKYEVTALLSNNGVKVSEVPLTYSGEASQFSATLDIEQPGTYQATVYAYDPATGNTGLDKTTFVIK